jgi:prepilin-type processing-associated H-X9-DG protein/prepilin-type N-terminal cleavage/methylation domain-containing protein
MRTARAAVKQRFAAHGAADGRTGVLAMSRSSSSSTAPRGAFTLVELMVVIAILVALVSILVPVVARARKQANNLKCLANLRGLGQAYTSYINANKHPPAWIDPTADPLNPWACTWIANFQSYCAPATFLCPDANSNQNSNPSDFGTAATAYGISTTPYSFGSYGLNGFLYWTNDPTQITNSPTSRGGVKNPFPSDTTPQQIQKRLDQYWFNDPLTADGGTVPTSVLNPPSPPPNPLTPIPTTFGGAGSIPVFADANQYAAWPQETDATPKKGSYVMSAGDQSATTSALGRFCLARHAGGVNIIFLDGHADTIQGWRLWQLRWNKSFIPREPPHGQGVTGTEFQ